MGFPPLGFRVMMFTIELSTYTFINQVSSLFKFHNSTNLKYPHLQLHIPPPFKTNKQTKNASQALAENKAIRKPVPVSE